MAFIPALPLEKRRPRDVIAKELEEAKLVLKNLEHELSAHSYCACGNIPLLWGQAPEILETGWQHTSKKCYPPPEGSIRCSCGYAVLRFGQNAWACASYSTGDDSRKPLMHTPIRCYEYGD